MRLTFQIIQAYSKQSIPSIVLNFESKKYFFNVPEPLQRLAKEQSVRFTKGSKIFITQMSTNHISGIFGLLLTLYENKLAFEVQLFGPPGFSSYLNNTRIIFGHRILAYSAYDFFNASQKLLGIKSLEMMEKVLSLRDYNKLFFQMNEYLAGVQKEHPKDIMDPQHSIQDNKFYKDENLEMHPLLLVADPSVPGKKPSLSYICKVNKVPGKVIAQKLKELKVPKNFVAKIIEKGELEVHGVLYKAKDFQEPVEPSSVLIIIDCPGKEYLESLINQETIKEYFEDKMDKSEQLMKAMVHMAPIEVLSDPRYVEFLEKFDKNCQHIFVNDSLKAKPIEIQLRKKSKESMHEEENKDGEIQEEKKAEEEESKDEDPKVQKQPKLRYRHFQLTNLLAKYFPSFFPTLGDLPRKDDYDIEKVYPNLPHKTVNSDLEYVLAPTKNQGFAKVNPSTKDFYLTNFNATEEFIKKYQTTLDKIKDKPKTENEAIRSMFKECDPEIVFLGTASMMPSAYRNVSGIYLRFWQQGDIGMLLDCGEGTYFQLLHHYGADKTRELLKNLSVIFITHVHADHHLGLMKIINERQKILDEEGIQKDPVFLVIPQNCSPWISKYSDVDHLNYRLVFNQDINVKRDLLILSKAKQMKAQETGKPDISKLKKNIDEEDEFECVDDPEEGNIVSHILQESLTNLPIFEKFLKETLGIKRFATVDVNHCQQACGVLIEHQDGWKFVYSGDTRPSKNMIDSFSPITILVHEATFTHKMQASAIKKAHSTDKEAVEVGMAMGAWRTILTHFSQRYAKSLNMNKMDKKLSKGKGKNAAQDSNQNETQKMEEEEEEVVDKTSQFYLYNKHRTVRTSDHLRFKFSELEYLPEVSRCLANMPLDDM